MFASGLHLAERLHLRGARRAGNINPARAVIGSK